MFIQTEETPNPEVLKFSSADIRFLSKGSYTFGTVEDAKDSPLALELFDLQGIGGVKSILIAEDFVSINKTEHFSWLVLKPVIIETIVEFFKQNKSVMINQESPSTSNHDYADDSLEARIEELFETRVRPALAQDGGDIHLEKVEGNVAWVRLKGACAGCPSAIMTLKSGVENMLRYYIPEIEEVKDVALDAEETMID